MSEQIDPTFKERVMPILGVIAGSAVRLIGVILVSKGAVDQTTFDSASAGLVEMVAGGLLYSSDYIWSRIKARLTVAKAVKVEVQTQVKQEVKEQVAVQVPVAISKELRQE